MSDEDEEFLAGIVKGKPWGSGPKDFMRKIFDGCVELLNVKKFKSAFRESLATQLRTWLNDPAPKFKFPFSHKQEECVIPYRRRRW